MNWLVPPPSLIAAVIKKMMYDEAVRVLIVPQWTSSPFWPILFSNGKQNDFVVDL